MADPIRTTSGDPVRYGERDAIGVESSGAKRGINAELAFIRDVHPVQTLEHNGLGIHDTPQVARAFLDLRWDGTEYRLGSRSYLLGDYGDTIATLTYSGVGVVDVALAQSIGGTSFAIMNASLQRAPAAYHATEGGLIVRPTIASIASGSSFVLHRYAGETDADLVLADGDFAVPIYSE